MRLLLMLFALILIGCKATQPSSVERFYSDTTIIKEIPRLVKVPGDTLISQSINIDSLAALLRAGVPPSVIEKLTIREDPVTRNRVGILIDELGNLTALCEIQNQQLTLMDREITRLTQDIQKTTVIEKPGFFQRIKSSLDLLVYTALLILAALFVIKKFLP